MSRLQFGPTSKSVVAFFVLFVICALNRHIAYGANTSANCNDYSVHPAPWPGFCDPGPWNGTDTGIIVDDFVPLVVKQAVWPKLWNGFDLSSYNTSDYQSAPRYAPKFAFIRLDKLYIKHYKQLHSVSKDIQTIPYYPLCVSCGLRQKRDYDQLNQAAVQERLAAFQKIGNQALSNVVDSLKDAGQTEIPLTSLPGLKGRLLALDVEDKLGHIVGKKGHCDSIDTDTSLREREAYALFYANALCTWIGGIRQHFPDSIIMLYTTPSVSGTYLAPLDNISKGPKGAESDYLTNLEQWTHFENQKQCLHGLPIWLAWTVGDGGDVIRPGSKTALEARQACIVSGHNRCIVHQYSHRGVFVQAGPIKAAKLPHIDLDRFFFVTKVSDSKDTYYVRDESVGSTGTSP